MKNKDEILVCNYCDTTKEVEEHLWITMCKTCYMLGVYLNDV